MHERICNLFNLSCITLNLRSDNKCKRYCDCQPAFLSASLLRHVRNSHNIGCVYSLSIHYGYQQTHVCTCPTASISLSVPIYFRLACGGAVFDLYFASIKAARPTPCLFLMVVPVPVVVHVTLVAWLLLPRPNVSVGTVGACFLSTVRGRHSYRLCQ